MTTNRRSPRLDPPSPAQPDANTLELLARVVAAGSFAQAARELGQTRAAVSRRIAHIEAQLGQALFTRSTRALGLTDAGRLLSVRARAVLDAAEAARRGLRSRAGAGLGGSLRITAVPIFAQTVLAPLLVRFQAKHPRLRIELRITQRQVDLLREDIDLAFRVSSKLPEDCVATPVLPFVVRAYAAPGPDWPLDDPAQLASQRCLLFSAPTEEAQLHWQHQSSGRQVAVTVQPTTLGDDLGTLLAVARAGGGVVFAPDFGALAELAHGSLVDVLPGWILPVTEGHAVQALTLSRATAPEAARRLVQFVRESAGEAKPAPGPSQAAAGSLATPAPDPSQAAAGSLATPAPGPSQAAAGSLATPAPGR